MSAVCRRSPVPSPPKSPDDLARLEAQQGRVEVAADGHLENNDEVDNEFNNPSYEVFEDHNQQSATAHVTGALPGTLNRPGAGVTINLNGRRPPTNHR